MPVQGGALGSDPLNWNKRCRRLKRRVSRQAYCKAIAESVVFFVYRSQAHYMRARSASRVALRGFFSLSLGGSLRSPSLRPERPSASSALGVHADPSIVVPGLS